MKPLFAAAAAVLIAGSAYAQGAQRSDATMAGSIVGNTGTTDNGSATNNPNLQTPPPGGSSTMAPAATMTVKNGTWMMGDRKATKAEIADWKKQNPSMSKPM